MLGKLNRNNIRNAFHKTKGFVGRAYNHTKGFLNDLDSGIRVAKDIYSIASALHVKVLERAGALLFLTRTLNIHWNVYL